MVQVKNISLEEIKKIGFSTRVAFEKFIKDNNITTNETEKKLLAKIKKIKLDKNRDDSLNKLFNKQVNKRGFTFDNFKKAVDILKQNKFYGKAKVNINYNEAIDLYNAFSSKMVKDFENVSVEEVDDYNKLGLERTYKTIEKVLDDNDEYIEEEIEIQEYTPKGIIEHNFKPIIKLASENKQALIVQRVKFYDTTIDENNPVLSFKYETKFDDNKENKEYLALFNTIKYNLYNASSGKTTIMDGFLFPTVYTASQDDAENSLTAEEQKDKQLIYLNSIYSEQAINNGTYTQENKSWALVNLYNNYYQDKFIEDVDVSNLKDDEISKAYKKFLDDNKFVENRYVIIQTNVIPNIDTLSNKLKNKFNQIYANNDNGTCVYDAFLNFFSKKEDKIGKSIYNKLISNKSIYCKSYPHDELINIAKFCRSSITIIDLVNGKDEVINEASKNLYNIKFINTKYNHLDLFVGDSIVKEVNDKDYKTLKREAKFYIEAYGTLYTYMNADILKLPMSERTIKNLPKYESTEIIAHKKQKSKFYKLFDEWKESVGLEKYYIYELDNSYQYLKSYDYGLHCKFKPVRGELFEYDLKKAYYNYHKYEYYRGLPSGSFITQSFDNNFDIDKFLECLNNGLVGFFNVEIINIPDNRFSKLGFSIGSKHLLYSSMIELLYNRDVEMKFISGCYCPSVDIKFTKEFLEKENGVRYYSKAFGIMFSKASPVDTTIKILEDDIDFYKNLVIEGKNIYYDNNIIRIENKNRKLKSYVHICYAIHAQTQTKLLNQLLDIDFSKLLAVKLDSFITNEHIDIDTEFFHDGFKDDGDFKIKIFKDDRFLRPYKLPYYSIVNPSSKLLYTDEIITNRIIYIDGKGGSAKTHSLLNTSCLPKYNICYLAPSWDLTIDKSNEFKNIFGLSYPKVSGLCGNKEARQVDLTNFKVFIQDELTLNDMKTYKKIEEENKHAFIFLLGHCDKDGKYYQCSIEGKINPVLPNKINCQYVKYTKNFRFDTVLNDRLDKLLEFMRINYDKKNRLDLLHNYILTEWKDRIFKKEQINYEDGDIGISSHNDLKRGKDLVAEYFLKKGAKPIYYTNKTYPERNIFKGSISYEKPNHQYYEIRLFNTIHSYQGRTIPIGHKLIINIKSLFDYQLFYTAVSRPKTVEQIHILI